MHLNKRIRFISILTVALFITGFSAADKWFLYHSTAQGYSVEFPKKPEESVQMVASAIGQLKMNMVMYDASKAGKDDNLIYMTNCTEYPDSLMNSDMTERLDEFFEGAINGAVANVKGKLMSEMEIEIDGYPGREIRIDYMDGVAIITMRTYLVNNKMIMLQVITETKKDWNTSLTLFMNSFKLNA